MKKHHKILIGSFTSIIIVFMIITGIILNTIIMHQQVNYEKLDSKINVLQINTNSQITEITTTLLQTKENLNKELSSIGTEIGSINEEFILLKASAGEDFSGIIEDVVKSGGNQLREGIPEFISTLNKNEMPLIILSASGLGKDAIKIFLEEENVLLNNVNIISNSYEWDSKGNAITAKEPIVHSMNKDLEVIRDLSVFEKIKNRGNVLLLGDNLSDSKVVDNIEFDNLIKIGFLNDNVGSNLEEYKENYDVILLGDPSMDYVNQLVNGLIK